LLQTVSNQAKRASSDQRDETAMNPRTVRANIAQLAEGEQLKHDTGCECPDSAKEPDPSNKVKLLDHDANARLQSGVTRASILGKEHAVPSELRPQGQQSRGGSGPSPGRAERSSTGREGASSMIDSTAQSGLERPEVGKEPDPSKKVKPLDHDGSAHVQSGVTQASILGQEHAVLSELSPQAQQSRGGSGPASARAERSSTGRELAGASSMMDGAAESGARMSDAAILQEATASQNPVASTSTGFEAVAANGERVANASVQHHFPEATKVSVLQQETHFPPVQQFNAPQQIANSVVAELNGSSAAASSAPPDPASIQSNAPDQPLKILTISLDPPALGNVTVRLRLMGNSVSVHLAADRRDTSQLLDQQRDSIRELMRSAGYVADVAPVQHGTLDGFQGGSGQSQPSLSGQQQSSHPQGTPDSFGQQQGDAKQTRQERHHNQETRHEQEVVSHNGRGAIFV
jgi:chemotaxis protein MotD